VEADEEVAAVREVDGGLQRLVEAGRVLAQDEDEVAAAEVDALLAAEGGLEGLEAVGDVLRVEAQAASGRVGGEDVGALVKAAEGHRGAGAFDGEGEVVEAVEHDVGGGDIGLRAREVMIGTAVNAVVADIDGGEQEARAAAGTGAGIGGVREHGARDTR